MDDFIVFLTDRYGRKDRTHEIKSIQQSQNQKVFQIEFLNNAVYTYKTENVQIVKNCLSDKKSAGVFDYLMQMAHFSEMRNDNGDNLLVKNLEKTKFINEDSVLARYLNPNTKHTDNSPKISSPIFPFGCNNSQIKAVKTALNNPVSIIQGPPGTGKTQTILNIIANLLMNEKTVLVVSNNNSATANVYEKLASEKYQMDFICATLGRKDNIDKFIAEQKRFYPEGLKTWRTIPPTFQVLLSDDIAKLESYFSAKERIAQIKEELSHIDLESKYFAESNASAFYERSRLENQKSSVLLTLLQKVQFKYAEKEKFGFFLKWKLNAKYKLCGFKFWKLDEEKLLATLKFLYYQIKPNELRTELAEKENAILGFNPEEVYKKCLDNLKSKLAHRYSNAERPHYESGKDFYYSMNSFTKEYPVIMSTTFSSRAALGGSKDFLFDYVIMDEASQVDVVTGAIAMSCCKNAVIVGDKMQLPNVIPEQQKLIIQKYFEAAHIADGYNFLNSFLASIEKVLPNTPQTLLREHYRCHPKIINFCNQQFYGGKLLIMTEDKGEENVLQAVKTVPGNFCSEHYNQRQIDVIKNEILPRYSETEIKNLGIIAPYNNQTNAIKSQIQGIDSDTVHKYQGREKDNIIITTVDNKISDFADDANLMNVAISRAKKKLAVVLNGNEEYNRNYEALLKYIEHNNFSVSESKLNSIFDFLYTKESVEKFNYLRSIKKISKFNSENAMNDLLAKITSEEKYSKFGFVFELPLRDIVSKNFVGTLPQELSDYASRSWSHVDFTIFNKVTKEILFGIEVDGYTYHKRGTVQSERDKKKDRIFSEYLKIELLRFGTKGSDEEEIIKTKFDEFL